MNKLYCGDNVEVMSGFDKESVDLIYMDPPYFSQHNYGEFDDRFDDIQAYLQWLRQRLEQCKRVLSDTGTIYCHLDWHAVHYVKAVMDDIFGYDNLRNEIIWCYHGGGITKRMFKRKHDTILFYTKDNNYIFNPQYKSEKSDKEYKKGVKIKNPPVFEDWWDDIPARGTATQAKEWLGYDTQKPEKLLERIIKASSNPEDVVLDPFCGCGTTCAVAKKLNRQYIGIDTSEKAIKLTQHRLNGIQEGLYNYD